MSTRFIARQPILDRQRQIFAYELLFRSGIENYFNPSASAPSPCASVVDSTLLFGMDNLTGHSRAFVNLSEEALLQEYAMLLPPDKIVCEILETVPPTAQTFEACKRLKKAKYQIALDDFGDQPEWEPFLEHIDFLKIDFLATPREKCRSLAQRFAGQKIGLIAEKVETREHFEVARALGYSYFQGYFLFRPEVLSQSSVPGSKIQYLRILAAASQPELCYEQIEEILKQDPSLCYKLLRYLNSAAFGLRQEIHSLRHGMALLGEKELRRWITVAALIALTDEQPGELIRAALIRGSFCESAAKLLQQNGRSTDFFLVGLLSMMDVILSRPLGAILQELALAGDVFDALLGSDNQLRQVLDLLLSYEQAHWQQVSARAAALSLPEDKLPDCYGSAVQWTARVLQG